MPMDGYERTQVILPTPQQLFTPGVTAILVTMFAGFLVSAFGGPGATNLLALNPAKVLHGMIWQVATYWVIEPSPWGLVLNGLIVLTVGSAVERHWRTASFLALWMVVCMVTAVIWVVVCLVVGDSIGWGATSGCFGLVGAMGLLFRGQRFFFFLATVDARVMSLILIGVGALMSLIVPITLIWVLGAVVAFVYIKLLWMGAQRSGAPTTRGRYKPGTFVDVD
jgi:membrane associated rhomboid family serine protease